MKSANIPAMPGTVWGFDNEGNKVQMIGGGLSKREYFAAQAMKGLLASLQPDQLVSHIDTARKAVAAADALLKALDEKS